MSHSLPAFEPVRKQAWIELRASELRNGKQDKVKVMILIDDTLEGCPVGSRLIPPLDVFALKDGKPQWLGYAETLAKALELAGKNGLGSYFVFSQETGHKTFYEISANGVVSRLLAPA